MEVCLEKARSFFESTSCVTVECEVMKEFQFQLAVAKCQSDYASAGETSRKIIQSNENSPVNHSGGATRI